MSGLDQLLGNDVDPVYGYALVRKDNPDEAQMPGSSLWIPVKEETDCYYRVVKMDEPNCDYVGMRVVVNSNNRSKWVFVKGTGLYLIPVEHIVGVVG